MAKKFIITKCGYYLLDEDGRVINDSEGNLLTFKEKEAALLYLKENKINGSVK